jgi:hypothetical protein
MRSMSGIYVRTSGFSISQGEQIIALESGPQRPVPPGEIDAFKTNQFETGDRGPTAYLPQ